jgi:hypothetical protein
MIDHSSPDIMQKNCPLFTFNSLFMSADDGETSVDGFNQFGRPERLFRMQLSMNLETCWHRRIILAVMMKMKWGWMPEMAGDAHSLSASTKPYPGRLLSSRITSGWQRTTGLPLHRRRRQQSRPDNPLTADLARNHRDFLVIFNEQDRVCHVVFILGQHRCAISILSLAHTTRHERRVAAPRN